MTDDRGLIGAYAVPDVRPVVAADVDAPPASWGEMFTASRDLALDDNSNAREYWMRDAFAPIYQAVNAQRAREGMPALPHPFDINPQFAGFGDQFMGGVENPHNEKLLFDEIRRIRQRDPKFLAGLPDDREKVKADARRRAMERRRSARAVVDRTPGVLPGIVGFAGGIVGTMRDPVNIATLPLGAGGTSVAGIFAREALLNGAVEAILQPVVGQNRAELGETLTAGEAAANVGMAAIGGGVLGAAPMAAADAYRAIAKRVRARNPRLADALDRGSPTNADILEANDAVLGPDATPADRAAAAVVRRQVEVDAASPFDDGGSGAGAERFNLELGDRIDALLSDEAPARTPAVKAPVSSPAPLPRAPIGSAGGRDQLKRRIGRAESPSDSARNPRSSATGRYQFTRDTFVAYHKRVFGGTASDAERWAQATDGAVQERLMDALIADNAAALSRAGAPETAGNLYLSHFAGTGGAVKVLRAAPDTPVRALLGDKAVEANPFLANMTAADLIAWAHRKMGEAPIAGDARLARVDGADEAELRAAQARLDEADMAAALDLDMRRRTADDWSPPAWEASLDRDLTPWDDGAAVANAPVPGPDPVIVQLADRVIAIERSGGSLKLDRVAFELDVSEVDAQRALTMAASRPDSNLRMARSGRVSRVPRQIAPEDVVRFLARKGGLRDDEGHNLTKGFASRAWGGVIAPGEGRLFRSTGMSLDRAGELLTEARYLHGEDWTEQDVLDVLERAIDGGERIYSLDDSTAAIEYETNRASRAEARLLRERARNAVATHIPDAPADRDLIADVAALVDRGMSDGEAVAIALDYQRYSNSVMVDELTGEALDDGNTTQLYPDDTSGERPRARDAGTGGSEPGPAGRGPGEGGADAPPDGVFREDAGGAEPLDDAAIARAATQGEGFDEPRGQGANAQAESLEHDTEMALTAPGPAIVGQLPVEGVAPAFMGKDGRIYTGTIGTQHFSAVSPKLREVGTDGAGFVTPEGVFLNRAEALEYVNANGENIKPSDNMVGELDALDYREQSRIARAGKMKDASSSEIAAAAAVDPAIAGRQRQEVELRAASPMRPAADQDSTIGLGLFDAADQPSFRLGEEGEESATGTLFDAIGRDAADLDAVRNCMVPKGAIE